MGKSAPSCFKILACGSRSVDHDDVQATESKGSSDRRGWSFRKRSARHRVLTGSVGQEVPQCANKENHEAKAVGVGVETGLDVTEKTPVVHVIDEKNVASTQQESKISDILVADDDACEEDCTFDEASVVKIQASIRGFLARRMLLKEKNVTNLQAFVRGQLVRRQAVGALRCVQAIIRIQTHVRAKRARLLVDGSIDSVKKAKKEAEPNSRYTYVSIEKLLANAFANQLVESTPMTKSLNIKCEPKLNSWKWLEMWTSVSTVSKEHHESGSAIIVEKSAASPEDSDTINVSVAAPGSLSEAAEVKPELPESVESSEDESNAIVYHAENFSFQPLKHVEPLLYPPEPEVTDSAPTKIKETDLNEIEAAKSLSKEESGIEVVKAEQTILSTEQPNTEVKRFSRKATNPAFIAAQSKFEDLSSAVTPLKSTSFSSYDQYSSATDQSIKSRDKVLADGVTSSASALGNGGSECGTELSISSTLDSSDGSEFGVIEIKPETGVPYENNHVTSREAYLDPSYAEAKELEESITPIKDSPLIENTPIENQKQSPENSPSHMSQITVPESQATPSSQVSVANYKKKSKEEKGEPRAKVRPMKRAHSNLNPDSASRNSMEHSLECKSRGTRNSFGSGKHDHKDQDPRDTTSSSNSLPGYMQATESARAKLIANGSPRSSPDVQDKDTFIKKRHSLPGSSDRHGSPRIQRSLSQAQENAKGNNTKSPQDRKWRR